MIYLLTSGSYSDYGVIGVIEGPDGLEDSDFEVVYKEYGLASDKHSRTVIKAFDDWLATHGLPGRTFLSGSAWRDARAQFQQEYVGGQALQLQTFVKACGWKWVPYKELHTNEY